MKTSTSVEKQNHQLTNRSSPVKQQHPHPPRQHPNHRSLALPNLARRYCNPRVLMWRRWRRGWRRRLVLLGLLVSSFFTVGCFCCCCWMLGFFMFHLKLIVCHSCHMLSYIDCSEKKCIWLLGFDSQGLSAGTDFAMIKVRLLLVFGKNGGLPFGFLKLISWCVRAVYLSRCLLWDTTLLIRISAQIWWTMSLIID